MDEADNPFAPGAGTQPPELAGRESITDGARTALRRINRGNPARSQIFLGLRGVGKTVLLNRINEMAEEEGYLTEVLEAPENQNLATMLVPKLRTMMFRLSRIEKSKDLAKRGLSVLRAFASAFKVSIGEVEFGVNPEEGTADSGNLEVDLPELLYVTAAAAKAAGKPMALLIDELQYLSSDDLAAIIVSVHKLGQKSHPFVFFGAGLPLLAGLAGDAKSYAERLFEYPEVGPLIGNAAELAISAPLMRKGVSVDQAALKFIIKQTRGYPYFLQEWGYQSWNTAKQSPISAKDVREANTTAIRRLDASFFRVRFDRLTPREKNYVRAMAQLGKGPHRSGEVARTMGISVTSAGPLRSGLIKKGMIYSPQHGDTAFTVPLFDEYVLRAMPKREDDSK